MKKLLVFLLLPYMLPVLAQDSDPAIGTAGDRKALFDYIIAKSLIRDAQSEYKNATFGFDPMAEMQKFEKEVVNASSQTELWIALQRLSASRRDSHLSIDAVKGGLQPPEVQKGQAPIRFHPDFSDTANVFLFVSDISSDITTYVNGKNLPAIGDKLLRVNDRSVAEYLRDVVQYDGYSTTNNFLMRAAYNLSSRSNALPATFFEKDLRLTLAGKNGRQYTVSLPYLGTTSVNWRYGREMRDYPGYELAWKKESFWLYAPTDPQNKTLLLWWYGFRSDLQEASDYLTDYAEEKGWLGYDLIIDAIDSRGGSQGAYAVARLTSKSFKTTGGNLKFSDITADFISRHLKNYLSGKKRMDGTEAESENDSWLIDWLTGDVIKGLAAGQEYSNSTPFKTAHLPAYSDWVMRPAKKHFTGKLAVLFGPWGGSHLDQFSAMIYDNNLGYTLGMPAGGYSNTWEWSEKLVFPGSGKPVVEFMWNIGHTLRPNGEVLEGNPAPVNEYVPVTRENYLEYRKMLIAKARAWFAMP